VIKIHNNKTELRGEFCLVIEGATKESWQSEDVNWWEDLSIHEHIEKYMIEKDLTSKAAIKEVAKDRGVAKRDIYQTYHVEG